MKFKMSTKALKAFLTLSVLLCSSISPALVTSAHAGQKRNPTSRPRRAKSANTNQAAPKNNPPVFKEDPIAAQARYQSGSYLESTGNLAGAETAYREAVKLDPKNAWYHHALGSLLQKMATPKPAKTFFPLNNPVGPNQDYGRTLSRQAEDGLRAGAVQNRINCLQRQAERRMQQQAIDRAGKRIEDHGGVVPRQAPPPLPVGDPCPPIGLSEPGPVFRPQAPAPDLTGPALPAPVEPWSNQPLAVYDSEGNSLFNTRPSLDEAVTELGSAAALQPGNAVYHSDYAAILFRTGKHNQAETEYRTAALLEPLSPGYHYSLGAVLEAELKWTEAAIAYNNALQLEPKNEAYKRQYKYAKKMAKK